METTIFSVALGALVLGNPIPAKHKRVAASSGSAEYIEVERNVKLHVTDLGEGTPFVLRINGT